MKKSLSILLTVAVAVLTLSTPAYAIKKCKDADGKWHYGDQAVRSCQNSKVTTLTDRGFIANEKSAPKTQDEIDAEKDAVIKAEKEAKLKKAQDDERNRILSVYETEADIDRQRDNQLGSVESNIAVHKSYLKAMTAKIERTNESIVGTKGKRKERLQATLTESKNEITEYTKRLKALKKQKEQISLKFAKEKEVYRQLKSNQ